MTRRLPTTRPRLLLPVALVGIVAALAACGGDDTDSSKATLDGMSGVEIREAVKGAMRDLTGVRLEATLPGEGGTVEIDGRVDADGDCDMTISTGPGQIKVVADADGTHLQGDRDYWIATTGSENGADEVLEQIGSKWVTVDPEDFASWCDLDTLIDGLTEGDEAEIEVGDVIDHDGQQAQVVRTIRDTDEITELLVAYEAPHVVLQTRGEGVNEGTELALSEFDEDVPTAVPPAEERIDLSQIGN